MNETVANFTPTSPGGARVFDRYEFVSESPAVGVLVLVVLVIAALMGAFGNILILVALCRSKMKSLEYIFIGNLAISDLYVTMVADPMSIVGELTLDRDIFSANFALVLLYNIHIIHKTQLTKCYIIYILKSSNF